MESLEPRHLLAGTPLVTEFLASNGGSLLDGDGNSSDWIEIHNPTTMPINLAGWHLTDNAGNLDKWTFPNAPQSVIAPGEYLVVFASGQATETYIDAGGNLHTDFRLGAGGEYLGLVNPALMVVHDYAPTFPPQTSDVSYGVYPQNLALGGFYFAQPTPGASNGVAAVSNTVAFSHPSQVFVGSLQLTLTGAAAGQQIRYTLDGTVPSESSPLYTVPLTIDSTQQVRARIFQTGLDAGATTSVSFSRLGADVQAFESQLPIMLIENFGGGAVPSKGWNQTGAGIQQVPRQSSAVTLFDNTSGLASFSTDVALHSRTGIRVRGAFSSTFPEPQYSLETWNESDRDRDVAVFGMAPASDWVLYAPNPIYDQTLFNNQLMFALAYPTSVWAPQVQFVEAFLNTDGGDVTMDDYVGLYVWTERVDRREGRIDFEPFAPDASSGGWLLSINRMDPIPEDDPSATPQHFHTPGPNGILQTPPNQSGVGDDHPQQYNAFINFEDPNGYELNPVQRAAIEDWFAEMEDVLYGRTAVAWNDPQDGYARYIDVDNFIDYYILHNLSRNGDGLLLSMWLYNPDPNNGGRLAFGPPWDHDLGSFEGPPTTELLHRADRLWYQRLFQDPAFVERYEQRWHLWRQSVLSDTSVNQILNSFVVEIGEAAAARDGVTDLPQRVAEVRNWLAARSAAIDEATGLALLVQFSADRTGGLPPLAVQFTDQSTVEGASSWLWDFGDGQTSTQQNPLHVYTTSGLFDVTLSVTGTSGTYSYTAQSFIDTVNVPGDVNIDGVLDNDDIADFIAGWRSDTSFLSDEARRRLGDLNLDGTTDFGDWFILRDAWQDAYGTALDLAGLISSEPSNLSGDYNNDGHVDQADYGVWRTYFGSIGNLPGDGNGDRVVDIADYVVWRDMLGSRIDNGAGGAALLVATESASDDQAAGNGVTPSGAATHSRAAGWAATLVGLSGQPGPASPAWAPTPALATTAVAPKVAIDDDAWSSLPLEADATAEPPLLFAGDRSNDEAWPRELTDEVFADWQLTEDSARRRYSPSRLASRPAR